MRTLAGGASRLDGRRSAWYVRRHQPIVEVRNQSHTGCSCDYSRFGTRELRRRTRPQAGQFAFGACAVRWRIYGGVCGREAPVPLPAYPRHR